MIKVTAFEIGKFAEKNNWIVINQSDKDDLKLGDDFICFLTPQGNQVIVGYEQDGSIKKIVSI